MTDTSKDPWRSPSLQNLRGEFARLERAAGTPQAQPTSRRVRRRRALVAPGGLAALALALVILLQSGGPAGALSIINRAPEAARRSKSVRFRSSTTVSIDGNTIQRLSQTGEIGFATGSYRTALRVGSTGQILERRSTGGILYVSQLSKLAFAAGWVAVRLSRVQRAALASGPESDAFTDPVALLRTLAHTSSPVQRVGRETVDGAWTTRYRAISDLAAVLSASAGARATPSAYRSVFAMLDVWLDRNGRPRRVIESFTGHATGRTASLRTETEFSGYGVPVEVRAPAGVRPSPALRGSLPNPLAAAPSRLFERIFFARP
jgi:hypothetical protein